MEQLPKTLEAAKSLFDYPSIETGLMSSEVDKCARILLKHLAIQEDEFNCNDPRMRSEYWDILKES